MHIEEFYDYGGKAVCSNHVLNIKIGKSLTLSFIGRSRLTTFSLIMIQSAKSFFDQFLSDKSNSIHLSGLWIELSELGDLANFENRKLISLISMEWLNLCDYSQIGGQLTAYCQIESDYTVKLEIVKITSSIDFKSDCL